MLKNGLKRLVFVFSMLVFLLAFAVLVVAYPILVLIGAIFPKWKKRMSKKLAKKAAKKLVKWARKTSKIKWGETMSKYGRIPTKEIESGPVNAEKPGRFPIDDMLRIHGFTIHSRPEREEPRWLWGKFTYRQSEALVVVQEWEEMRE